MRKNLIFNAFYISPQKRESVSILLVYDIWRNDNSDGGASPHFWTDKIRSRNFKKNLTFAV